MTLKSFSTNNFMIENCNGYATPVDKDNDRFKLSMPTKFRGRTLTARYIEFERQQIDELIELLNNAKDLL